VLLLPLLTLVLLMLIRAQGFGVTLFLSSIQPLGEAGKSCADVLDCCTCSNGRKALPDEFNVALTL
jgi:hypothetical protein